MSARPAVPGGGAQNLAHQGAFLRRWRARGLQTPQEVPPFQGYSVVTPNRHFCQPGSSSHRSRPNSRYTMSRASFGAPPAAALSCRAIPISGYATAQESYTRRHRGGYSLISPRHLDAVGSFALSHVGVRHYLLAQAPSHHACNLHRQVCMRATFTIKVRITQ